MKKHPSPPFGTKAATRAVIAVSPERRGFVVEGRFPNPLKTKPKGWRGPFRPSRFRTRRYVITAAHCLPHSLPPPHRKAYTAEKTFKKLLGPLGKVPSVWAECVFVDPVSDLAVLARPDGQAFSEKVSLAWDKLIDTVQPLELDTRRQRRGWMLSLDGEWLRCTIQITRFAGLMVKDAVGGTAPGMSGSPILSDNERVVGIVSISGNWPQAHLPSTLPQWLARQLTRRSK